MELDMLLQKYPYVSRKEIEKIRDTSYQPIFLESVVESLNKRRKKEEIKGREHLRVGPLVQVLSAKLVCNRNDENEPLEICGRIYSVFLSHDNKSEVHDLYNQGPDNPERLGPRSMLTLIGPTETSHPLNVCKLMLSNAIVVVDIWDKAQKYAFAQGIFMMEGENTSDYEQEKLRIVHGEGGYQLEVRYIAMPYAVLCRLEVQFYRKIKSEEYKPIDRAVKVRGKIVAKYSNIDECRLFEKHDEFEELVIDKPKMLSLSRCWLSLPAYSSLILDMDLSVFHSTKHNTIKDEIEFPARNSWISDEAIAVDDDDDDVFMQVNVAWFPHYTEENAWVLHHPRLCNLLLCRHPIVRAWSPHSTYMVPYRWKWRERYPHLVPPWLERLQQNPKEFKWLRDPEVFTWYLRDEIGYERFPYEHNLKWTYPQRLPLFPLNTLEFGNEENDIAIEDKLLDHNESSSSTIHRTPRTTKEELYPSPSLEVYSLFIGRENTHDMRLFGTIEASFGDQSFHIFNRVEKDAFELTKNSKTAPILDGYRVYDDDCSIIIKFNLEDVDCNLSIIGYVDWNLEQRDSYPSWYDKQLCSVIQGKHGFVAVHYTIFSSAVQAKIEVHCKPKMDGSFYVYGSIVAHYDGYDYSTFYKDKYYRIVLFKGTKQDSLTLGVDGSVPISRSIVVVPSNSSLITELDLSFINLSSGLTSDSVRYGVKIEIGETCKRFETEDCSVDILVNWSGDDLFNGCFVSDWKR